MFGEILIKLGGILIMEKNLTMKEMPGSEQPYEKCMLSGAKVLSDAELLAVIIRTGSKGEKSIELSRKVLNLSNYNQGILGLNHLSYHDLLKIKGIGKVKAIQILCIVELSRRMAKARALNHLSFTSPVTIADYYMEDLRHKEQEHLILMMLNTKNRLICDQVLTKGTVNSSLISPREIFIESLKKDAVYIILVHNHPSGDPTPSKEDIAVTMRLKEAGALIGIFLLDHIIIGDNRYISMKERGIL